MLTSIILLPNVAFAEVPEGCLLAGSIEGSITVEPSAKAWQNTAHKITYVISNPFEDDLDINPLGLDSCDSEVVFAEALVEGFPVSGTPTCEFDPTQLPFPLGNDESVQIWGQFGIMGECIVPGPLPTGLIEFRGQGNVHQFNIDDFDELFSDQDAGVEIEKLVFGACIDVQKNGPPKVKLVETAPGSGIFEAIVEYSLDITNCGDQFDFPSDLDTCVVKDSANGAPQTMPDVTPEIGTIAPGFTKSVTYAMAINGDTTNVAEVTCKDQAGNDHTDSDDHTVLTYTAGITVEKDAPPKLAATDSVDYTVKVTNDGSSTISQCRAVDAQLNYDAFPPECASVPAGESCTFTIAGPVCTEAPESNTVTVTCKDQAGLDVSDSDSADAPRCSQYAVEITKLCNEKAIFVPGQEPPTIDCTIKLDNLGDEVTKCSVDDNLTGNLVGEGENQFPSQLPEGFSKTINTSTAVTPEMVDQMLVTNKVVVSCNTQENFPPVGDDDSADIKIRSIDATVEKNCTPLTQPEIGVINWDWKITNTSPDGKSSLDVSCDGFSTFANPDLNDEFDGVLGFVDGVGEMESRAWSTPGLDDGTYSNKIICTFTAQEKYSFQVEDDATCEVTPIVLGGCTPGYWKNNWTSWEAVSWAAPYNNMVTPMTLDDAGFETNLVDDSLTLREALALQGNKKSGGAEANLIRHAVAAMLNAANTDVGNPLGGPQAVIDFTNDAIAEAEALFALGTKEGDLAANNALNDAKNELAGYNEQGCTIDQHGNLIESDDS